MNICIRLIAIILTLQIVVGLKVKKPQDCFDVLDKLPKDEIKNIYYMNFKDIAHSHPAADILSCYLRESHHGDKSLDEQYFDVYKKCDEYAKNNFEPFGYQQLEQLVSLGLPFSLEKYLRAKMETGNKKELKQGILHVQDVMSKDIELSLDYKEYKKIILNKFKPSSNAYFGSLNMKDPENTNRDMKETNTKKTLTSTNFNTHEEFFKFLAKIFYG